jgi:hypothetical protein
MKESSLIEAASSFMEELYTPGTKLYSLRRSPAWVYGRFVEKFTDYQFIVKDKEFYVFLEKYAKSENKDRAITKFIELSKAKRKSNMRQSKKGIKTVRGKEYDNLKYIYELYQEILADEYGDKRLYFLIAEKSYLLQKYETEKDTDTKYLEKYFKSETIYDKDLLRQLNEIVITHIHFFALALEYHATILFKKHSPKVKMWFVDKFRDMSFRYLPDWKKYSRKSSTRLPGFEESWKTFKKFTIDGVSANRLGYTSSTFHHFTERVKPQGMINLLFLIYIPLYSARDQELIQEERDTEMMKDAFKKVFETKNKGTFLP